MFKACEYCANWFETRHDWQCLCRDCYKLRQQYGGKDGWIMAMDLARECDRLRFELARRPLVPPPYAQGVEPAERALLDHIRANPKAWLMLVHPDKHDGSQTATEATRLILAARKGVAHG